MHKAQNYEVTFVNMFRINVQVVHKKSINRRKELGKSFKFCMPPFS